MPLAFADERSSLCALPGLRPIGIMARKWLRFAKKITFAVLSGVRKCGIRNRDNSTSGRALECKHIADGERSGHRGRAGYLCSLPSTSTEARAGSAFLETDTGTVVILVQEDNPARLKRSLKLRERIAISVGAILIPAHRGGCHARDRWTSVHPLVFPRLPAPQFQQGAADRFPDRIAVLVALGTKLVAHVVPFRTLAAPSPSPSRRRPGLMWRLDQVECPSPLSRPLTPGDGTSSSSRQGVIARTPVESTAISMRKFRR